MREILEWLLAYNGPILLKKDLHAQFGMQELNDALPLPGVTFAPDTTVFVDREAVRAALNTEG